MHRLCWQLNSRSPLCVVVCPTTMVSMDAVTIKNGTGQNLCLLKRCCFCSFILLPRQQCCAAVEEVEKSLAGCVTLINVNRVSRNLINCENSHARKKENWFVRLDTFCFKPEITQIQANFRRVHRLLNTFRFLFETNNVLGENKKYEFCNLTFLCVSSGSSLWMKNRKTFSKGLVA